MYFSSGRLKSSEPVRYMAFFHYSKWRRQAHMLTYECVCFFPLTCNCLVAPSSLLSWKPFNQYWLKSFISKWIVSVNTCGFVHSSNASCDEDRESCSGRLEWIYGMIFKIGGHAGGCYRFIWNRCGNETLEQPAGCVWNVWIINSKNVQWLTLRWN